MSLGLGVNLETDREPSEGFLYALRTRESKCNPQENSRKMAASVRTLGNKTNSTHSFGLALCQSQLLVGRALTCFLHKIIVVWNANVHDLKAAPSLKRGVKCSDINQHKASRCGKCPRPSHFPATRGSYSEHIFPPDCVILSFIPNKCSARLNIFSGTTKKHLCSK